MDKEFVKNQLETWAKVQEDSYQRFRNLLDPLGICEDSELYTILDVALEKYTEAVAELLKIDVEALYWFAYENEYGKSGLDYQINKTVENINDFIDAVCTS